MQPELENLKLALTSPRERSPTTVSNYIYAAKHFLAWQGNKLPPSEMDLRKFFLEKKEGGSGAGNQGYYFYVLRKLFEANHWPWPFKREDRPEAPEEVFAPVFTLDELKILIQDRENYSDEERFYLALSTTYGIRREELARVRNRDIKDGAIFIRTVKRGPKRTALIPGEIMPVINNYRPRERKPRSLSAVFRRVADKSSLDVEKGYGWHSIRRTLLTMMEIALAQNGMPLTWAADYLGWSKKTIGSRYFGVVTAGVYRHPEAMSQDPYALDKAILPVHPFVKLWVN